MRYLTDFQKQVIIELLNQPKLERAELSKNLLKFLPENLQLERGIAGELRAFYLMDQNKLISSDVSIKVLEFINLVKSLTQNNYLIRVQPESYRKDLFIGEATDQPQFVGMRLSTDISTEDLDTVFVKYDYFVTSKLLHLKKHNYKQDDDYRTDQRLKYLFITAICALITAFISLYTTLNRCI